MKNIIKQILKGGGKTQSFLLATLLAFAGAQTARANTNEKEWNGSGDRYWATAGNWQTLRASKIGYY